MLIHLVEDSETFEAALHFVDEYVEADAAATSFEQRDDDDAALALALDGLPSPTELALVETLMPEAAKAAPVVKTSAKKQTNRSAKTAASKPKKLLTYNPNRAREQQRKELLYLREKVEEMEQELKALQGTRHPKTSAQLEAHESGERGGRELSAAQSSGFQAPDVWKEMASHQLEQRLTSERENRRLKAVLEGQIKIGKSLAKLLEATSTTQMSCQSGNPPIYTGALTFLFFVWAFAADGVVCVWTSTHEKDARFCAGSYGSRDLCSAHGGCGRLIPRGGRRIPG